MPNDIFLKGCPLCGYPASVQTKRDSDLRKLINPNLVRLKGEEALHKVFYYVACTKCKVRTATFNSSVLAITAWNQRVDPDKKRRTSGFPKGPWKYYHNPDDSESYSIANTTPKLETLQHLCDIHPDSSLAPYVVESMMRLLTAGPAMYKRLNRTLEILDLVIPHLDAEKTSRKKTGDGSSPPPVFSTKLLKGLQADIKLLLAGIEGESVTFNPETDTLQLKNKLPAQNPVPHGRTTRPRLKPINQKSIYLLEEDTEDAEAEVLIEEGDL